MGVSGGGHGAGWPLEPWTIQLLADLQAGDYQPTAWVRFFHESWRRARATARHYPALLDAWRNLSLAVLAGSAVPLTCAWRRYGSRPARRMGGMLLAGLALQQADAYIHLGLNRRLPDGLLLPAFGPAIWLSYLRGSVAYWLLAATGAGLDISRLAPGALIVGALTDALDGPIAHRLGQATKLGAYVDGEADLVLAVALTQAAVRHGALPARARWLPAARYALPVGVAFGAALLGGRTPALEHTLLGRLCGVAQTGLLGCALAPRHFQPSDRSRRRLLAITAALSAASAVAQVPRILGAGQRDGWPRR
ncbi:MAG TPA: CDP-alcohol phosphatidyltransferase family protein [Chloroflexota bacterium]|nr:CDP-alcohol phosphatidyltransferase family protein [Chloroflexota bacterium]